MRGPDDFPLTDEEKESVARKIANIEARATAGGPWPAIMGPVHLERRVFEAVLKELLDAGWNAGFSSQGMLVIRGKRI
jgi:hypothetical protein